MSAIFEPREVEKPFRKRWLRMTWRLFVRSPVRFGILIAALGWMDTSAVNLAYRLVIPKVWAETLGMLVLPLLFALISAIARGADDTAKTWTALRQFLRPNVWVKAICAGAFVACVKWAFSLLVSGLFELSPDPSTYSARPGKLLEIVSAQTWLITVFFGICFSPLIVFEPELSLVETRRLSQLASNINGWTKINWLYIGLLCCGLPALLIPAYGMTMAACLVFVGAVNYAAYRDIFERRDENLPAKVAIQTAMVTQ